MAHDARGDRLRVAAVFVGLTATARALTRQRIVASLERPWRGLAVAVAALLVTIAAQVYFGRFDRLFDDHTIFSGVDYTQAHITLAGLLVVCGALVVGAAIALTAAVRMPRLPWIAGSVVPAVVCYIAVQLVAWYVSTLIVRPNQLNRERPYIAHNIALTRRAYDLDRIQVHPFPADVGIAAVDPSQNQTTLDNIRLWDWRALQDGLRQIQEIRTYYDFPEIDIDRYQLGGRLREMMLAARELNVDKLPVSSQTWINEKLIYTHGYGVAMTSVNGFTPEGLPQLVLKNMPVESSLQGLAITRPEIYFGELTDTDVYVKTRQREFNYPQGEQNNLASYQGSGGIRLGGLLRRTIIAYDRGDIAKLPFSDDVTDDSRLLMRRNILARVQTLAPFFTFDPDPYIVVASDGRLYWIIDAYTTSDTYPYSSRYLLGDEPYNYIRNSVKIVVDAYTGATTFYVFDSNDPVLDAYRNLFPALFRDQSAMPADLRAHVRYPELLLTAQADVYALYHMTDPEVFYNREDLWQVAMEVRSQGEGPEDAEANYVLMTLPGEQTTEFIDILPFTPANRNNLIGWIGGRSDGAHYGEAVVYNFPKSKLVDGPLQVEARIDQNASISGQLTLWNQQGSHVRRGQPPRDTGRQGAALCPADLSAGGEQPDAGAAPRGARAARPVCVRSDVRDGYGGAVQRRTIDVECATGVGRGSCSCSCSARSSRCRAAGSAGRDECPDRLGRAGFRGLPATHSGRQACRGGEEARGAQAHAREAEEQAAVSPRWEPSMVGLRISYQLGDDRCHLVEDLTNAFGSAFLLFPGGGGVVALEGEPSLAVADIFEENLVDVAFAVLGGEAVV